MSGNKARAVAVSIGLPAILTIVALAVNARWAAAGEGWKYDVPIWGGCVVDCTPAPEFGIHCPCYEMPPIVIDG